MVQFSSTLAGLAIFLIMSAAPITIALGPTGKTLSIAVAATNAKAIHFMMNAANNSIVALKVAADGTLSSGPITATGGAGMNGVDSTGAPAVPDALFSQAQ